MAKHAEAIVVNDDHRWPRIQVYWEPADWWVGWYRGATHHYVCILPSIVIRWRRWHRSYWGDTWHRCYCDTGHAHGINKTAHLLSHDSEADHG